MEYYTVEVSNTKDGINNRVLNNVGEDIVKVKIKLLYKSRSAFRFNIVSRNLPYTSRWSWESDWKGLSKVWSWTRNRRSNSRGIMKQ